MDLKVPETWDEYWNQVEFFNRDNDADGERDLSGAVTQGRRGDCISMQWANYPYSQGGRFCTKLAGAPERGQVATSLTARVPSKCPDTVNTRGQLCVVKGTRS